MTVIIEKKEYDIMLLASRYKEAFSVPGMRMPGLPTRFPLK